MWWNLDLSWAGAGHHKELRARADNTHRGPGLAADCPAHSTILLIILIWTTNVMVIPAISTSPPPLLTLHNWITKHIPQGSEKMSLICIQTSRHKSAWIHHHFHLYSACLVVMEEIKKTFTRDSSLNWCCPLLLFFKECLSISSFFF